MRRIALPTALAAALVLVPVTALGAQKAGCPNEASGWFLVSPIAIAEDFFEHLIPGIFPNAGALAADIDANADDNGDDLVCARLAWGDDLNPKSHWYRVGVDILGEPLHTLTVRDNTANGS